MARTWLSIKVELLGGRGEDLWPYPGRVLVTGPSHTFAQLAKAIDDAFARWDRAHLCQFTLADGTVVTDEETADDALDTPFGPLPKRPLVLEQTKVARQVVPGEEFRYVFDFGDDWTYACTVEEPKVDPADVLGVVPRVPTVAWGWGTIPDQYGRRWDDDDGETPMPRRPARPHPMLWNEWPAGGPGVPVDVSDLRGAIARRDIPAILAAIEGRDVDDLLQHVGVGLQIVLASDRTRGDAVAASVLNRLDLRGWPGDDILAEDLLAELRGTPPATRQVPVDLQELGSALSGGPAEPAGYLDLHTGEVIPGALVDAMDGDEAEAIDVADDPDRWLELDASGSRERWQDMADFAARQPNSDLRRRLVSATEGKGAFRRFADAIHQEDLAAQWYPFSDDRQSGRARAWLADAGIRAVPPR
ncbi:hypothetical protein KM427_06495 [Nocardioides sp. LMS-CY]|uniref:UPF0158 family protein n=1 Tax=Nocardioides sp. (strain LMS-CY) TaxID=2840457 RepID=UPI001C005A28|nr:UPF0158 family protein [Nocardioides sp. LMS-CY]QWF23368.1 hypothetical protein KM427_06495 [Nocardioides sp. LMS-CY]